MTSNFPRQTLSRPAYKKLATTSFLILLVFVAGLFPAFAGSSFYGKVTEVKSANAVIFNYGAGQYPITLVGVDVPREGPITKQAKAFITELVLGKNVRMRFQGRLENGNIRARLFTDDPKIGIKDVSVELVRAGLARQPKGFDFKYGHLAKAEKEARDAGRGLWATGQSQ